MNIYGYVSIYSRINFTNKTSVVALIEFDFTKPITEKAFEDLTNIYKNYYEKEFDNYHVENVEFITKEEYETEYKAEGEITGKWDENNIIFKKDGEIIANKKIEA
jgi:hypothetical protein